MAWPCFDPRCLWSCYLYTSCCWHACDLGDKESYLGSDAGLQGLNSVGRRQWNCCQPSHHRHWSVRQGYRSKWTAFSSPTGVSNWSWKVLLHVISCTEQTFRYSREFSYSLQNGFSQSFFLLKVYFYARNMKSNFLEKLLYKVFRFCDLLWF